MTVYELARQLGMEMSKSEEAVELNKARVEYYSNKEVQQLFDDFEKLKQDYQMKASDKNTAEEELEEAKNKLIAAEKVIRANAIASKLLNAEMNFNNYVNSVISIIGATVTGKDPQGGCSSGGCSSCGGGCH